MQAPAHAVGFALPSRTVTLPIVMVRQYPFVEAEVNGVRGKLMLDTGAHDALILNDHRIALVDARVIGTNQFGSGQTFVQRISPRIRSVVLPRGLRYTGVANVESQDATQLESITPDFIGWIGYDFFKGHAMELDYRRLRVTFRPSGQCAGGASALAPGRPIFTVRFELRRLPNHPIIPVRIGDEAFTAAFDTGQYGTLYADAAVQARLADQRAITGIGESSDGRHAALSEWNMAGHELPAVPRVALDTGPFAAAKGLAITEPNIVTLGYGLLHRYRTIWNWQRREIAFYPR